MTANCRCIVCGKCFVSQRRTAKLCCDECRVAHHRSLARERYRRIIADEAAKQALWARKQEYQRKRRRDDPEYRERGLAACHQRYANDPEYRERAKARARARYHDNPERAREYARERYRARHGKRKRKEI